eukprot:gene2690-4180_t
MGRWGAAAPLTAPDASGDVEIPPVPADGTTTLSPELGDAPVMGGRWRRVSDMGDTVLHDGEPPGPQVNFAFGDSDDAVLLSHGDHQSDASDTAHVAACLACGSTQEIQLPPRPSAEGQHPPVPVPCHACGAKRVASAWLWRSFPPVELSDPVLYHTPRYASLLADRLTYPTIQDASPVEHQAMNPTYHPNLPPPMAPSVQCPFGVGDLHAFRNVFAGDSLVHFLSQSEGRDVKKKWTYGIAQASGAALVAKGLQEAVRALAAGGPALGDGLFDRLLQRQADFGRVLLHAAPRVQQRGAEADSP